MPESYQTYDWNARTHKPPRFFQSATKRNDGNSNMVHMFNLHLLKPHSRLDDRVPKETIDSYDDLKKAFLENYLQQKKCIKDPVEIHNIRQRDGESTEEFVWRYKLECKDVKVAASNRERKKSFPSWKQQEAKQKKIFKKGGFRNQQKSERKQDRFALLTKTPKEIFALGKGKFKAPPPMTTPVEKRNARKFCEFHGEVGYNTDECMHLRKQIEEMLKEGKLSHLIKELNRTTERSNLRQSFSPNTEISFPPLDEDEGTEGPMIIEAE
ncbi:reverse transcriptase domain-containing protein [Tanacetum coccineum]